ncbi:hypothetical protein MTO96_006692 [Rhipicephalus appendiculatus]
MPGSRRGPRGHLTLVRPGKVASPGRAPEAGVVHLGSTPAEGHGEVSALRLVSYRKGTLTIKEARRVSRRPGATRVVDRARSHCVVH